MLVRILADNPGQTFTRNIDAKFVDTTKQVLRNGRDMSVRQILTETLSTFEREKSADPGLALLLEMWKTEQVKIIKAIGPNVRILYPAVSLTVMAYIRSLPGPTSSSSAPVRILRCTLPELLLPPPPPLSSSP